MRIWTKNRCWSLSSLRFSLQSTLDEIAAGATIAQRIQAVRFAWIERVAKTAILESGARPLGFSARLSQLTTHPVWGWFVLAGILYALYWLVGVFGAGVLVNYLEKNLFGQVINPLISQFVHRLLPITWLADLFVGPYGLWTMGVTYALALILPIVTTFFLAFGVMEDFGLLAAPGSPEQPDVQSPRAEWQSRAPHGARLGLCHHGDHHHPRARDQTRASAWPHSCWRWPSLVRLSWAS